MRKTDDEYLHEAIGEGYSSFTKDPDALPAFQRLEQLGFVRVIYDGPAWRILQSSEQHDAARRHLAV